MGDILSLKRKRKELSRAAREKTAAANRQKFGRSKAEKSLTALEDVRAQKSLDAHKRDS